MRENPWMKLAALLLLSPWCQYKTEWPEMAVLGFRLLPLTMPTQVRA